jgi:hypothetical protein
LRAPLFLLSLAVSFFIGFLSVGFFTGLDLHLCVFPSQLPWALSLAIELDTSGVAWLSRGLRANLHLSGSSLLCFLHAFVSIVVSCFPQWILLLMAKSKPSA